MLSAPFFSLTLERKASSVFASVSASVTIDGVNRFHNVAINLFRMVRVSDMVLEPSNTLIVLLPNRSVDTWSCFMTPKKSVGKKAISLEQT